MNQKKIKILLGKIGVDGHDIGLKVLSQAFRDDGMEVVYLGAFNTTDAIIKSAVQEDVDIIGLSFLGGAHIYYSQEIMDELKTRNINLPVVVGGVIPRIDIQPLMDMGIKGVFESGSDMSEIIKTIRKTLN